MPLTSRISQTHPPLLRTLDTVGDGSGAHDFIGDYSVVATQAIIKPPDNEIYMLTEFVAQYSDAGKFQQNVYGSLAAALPNGLIIGAYDRENNLIFSLSNGNPIITNDLWAHLGYVGDLLEWGVATTTTLTAALDSISFGTEFPLNGNKGEYLKVDLSDNFTGLIDQTFLAKGYIMK